MILVPHFHSITPSHPFYKRPGYNPIKALIPVRHYNETIYQTTIVLAMIQNLLQQSIDLQ